MQTGIDDSNIDPAFMDNESPVDLCLNDGSDDEEVHKHILFYFILISL